jgi:ankyrin repeat domain-containing protein 50
LQQLVRRNSVISDDILLLYRKHSQKQTRPTLCELSKLLQLEVRCFSKVFILINALDECCESNSTRDIFIAEIRKLQTIIHLLITSRYILTIEREFEKVAQVEICASDEDVRRYLECRIKSEDRLMRLIKADLALQATITNTIVENAKGM